MAKPRFLFSSSMPITQPYRDEDSPETPYSVAVMLTHSDHLPSSDTLAPTPVVAYHTIDTPSKEVYTRLDKESAQIPLQEEFVLAGHSNRQSHRRFWMVLSLAIGMLLIFAIGVGVGVPSSLHDPANIKSNSSSGVDIGSGIHIRIGRAGNSSNNGNSSSSSGSSGPTNNQPNNPAYCITNNCPSDGSGSSSSGNSGSSSGNSSSSNNGSGSGNSSGSGGGSHNSSNRATGSAIATLAMAATAAAFLSVW